MKKAIIADDGRIWRREYRRIIESTVPGTEVDEVRTGEELVEKVLAEDYDLVLTDNNMPPGDLTGVEAIEQIRAAGVETPTYAISSNDIEGEVLDAGGTGFISKGYFRPVLEEAVRLHLGGN